MGAPEPLRTLLVAGTAFVGGVVAVSIAASATIKVIRSTMEAKRRSLAKPCQACKGKGLYICKLCKGSNTIEWSPLFDPVHINPCQCPTCEGRSVQRCLNCLGKGYF